MKTHDNSVVDLGDARIETRGKGVLGPLDAPRLAGPFDAANRAAFLSPGGWGAGGAARHWRVLHVILSSS